MLDGEEVFLPPVLLDEVLSGVGISRLVLTAAFAMLAILNG